MKSGRCTIITENKQRLEFGDKAGCILNSLNSLQNSTRTAIFDTSLLLKSEASRLDNRQGELLKQPRLISSTTSDSG